MCFVICNIIICIFTTINYKTYILKTKNEKKIKCIRCKKAPITKLKNPVFLQDKTTEYCTNCHTELAYVDGNNFIPKYNIWLIRTNTAMIINN